MKKILLLLLPVALLSSCCIKPPRYAQSDLLDTHRKYFECLPCEGKQNKPESYLTLEGYGPSGKIAAGAEFGYNFMLAGVYGNLNYGWWPSPSKRSTVYGEIGLLGFNPNLSVRPEIGIGMGQWMIRPAEQPVRLHPNGNFPLVQEGHYSFWQAYAGIRWSVPATNISVNPRLYYLHDKGGFKGSAWVPSVCLGFRFRFAHS